MKAKKILCSLLSVAMIGSAGALMVNAADYIEHVNMYNNWENSRLGGNLVCRYWIGSQFLDHSAQSSLYVSYLPSQKATVYVYILGQGRSVGNRKEASTMGSGWISTERCYATGKIASRTYHSYQHGSEANSITFYNK